ncbi:NmrA family NAD(P)-binding protein [Mesorhizobium sp. PAMC28654]|uniref:SDR family oxidoreductase n=1 Tax=Mesorhizobium sp. PAMC28654 TaxID=2880934 RepID=UPI001D0B0B5B|nr:NmrA family NAD(P)-binding protein [Mesorhizobium sp. PAMC28654]UDL91970.1 NmrA family NAD(P)-binding protein [Mesorhizobium sp. PAMC28654]
MSNLKQRVLVYLANGVQGGAVAREAARRGFAVTALVRDRAGGDDLAKAGIDLAHGDLADPSSLDAAHAGVTEIVLQMPIGPLEMIRGFAANALAAARNVQVKMVVLKLASASRAAPCDEPSFIANGVIEAMVRSSGLPHAIVRPTMYLDNLLKPGVRQEVADGVFQVPIDVSQRIAWTSADDCAAAAMTLIENKAFWGDHLISGPDSVNGAELTAALSAGLGWKVIYRSESLFDFEREVDAAMGAGVGERVGSKFRFFQNHKDEADAILAPTYVPQLGLEGFCPSSIENWVRQHVNAFTETPRRASTR